MTRAQTAKLYVSPAFITKVLSLLVSRGSYAPLSRTERADAAVIYQDADGSEQIAAEQIFAARRAANDNAAGAR